MPANARTLRGRSAVHGVGVRYQPAMKHRSRAGFVDEVLRDHTLRSGIVADHQQRVGALHLRGERRAQRPSRKDATIADAAPAVDHGDGPILGERRILQAVIHDHDGRALGFRQRGAGDAVAGNNGRRRARQQQGFVADQAGRIGVGVDALWHGVAAAIAARQAERRFAGLAQQRHQHHGGRRLAGAAECEIADAQHRYAGGCAALGHAPRGDGAIGFS